MKKTKLTAAALLLVLIVGVFCGCADIRSIREHNAEIYNVEDMLLSTFIDEHRLGGMYYENPDYVEGVDDYTITLTFTTADGQTTVCTYNLATYYKGLEGNDIATVVLNSLRNYSNVARAYVMAANNK